jgi:ABC-type oligopeptide transport system substrate-binding subunit
MQRNTLRLLAIAAVAAPLALGACKRSDTASTAPAPAPPTATVESPPPTAPPAPAPFRVTTPSAVLGTSDTIYASVASDGSSPSVTLTAKWIYEDGQVVDETSQTIAPNGPAASEFHIAKPDGWPAGKYQVEILADGKSVGTKQFEIR